MIGRAPAFLTAAAVVVIGLAGAKPFPQTLTEAEFRGLGGDISSEGPAAAAADPANRVAILTGYRQVRRQGRMHGGEIFSFKQPLTVRDPLAFAALTSAAGSARSFSSLVESARNAPLQRVEAAPVFSLSDMLRKEAAELKAKIREASLKAAKAAEQAEEDVKKMMDKVSSSDVDSDEVEQMIENAVQEGIAEAEGIIAAQLEDAEELLEVEQEIEDEEKDIISSKKKKKDPEPSESLNDINNSGKEKKVETVEEGEQPPSSEIDLGFVQEV